MQDQFDTALPKANHEQRFLEKLKNQQRDVVILNTKKRSYWKPLLAVAASIVLIITLFIGKQSQEAPYDLANVSPEMADTQDFFTATIAQELGKLEIETSPQAKYLAEDAIKRIALLEREYNALKEDLQASGNDKRVIYAMISNFQNRIDILQSVLLQIENIKHLQQNI
jgi:hypothetical protein